MNDFERTKEILAVFLIENAQSATLTELESGQYRLIYTLEDIDIVGDWATVFTKALEIIKQL